MTWAIHRVSLATNNLTAAQTFFGPNLGLGASMRVNENTMTFGKGSRGLRVVKPERMLVRGKDGLMGAAGARHVAIEVAHLDAVVTKLAQASISHVEAPPGDFDVPAIYTIDPAGNIVAFCQAVASQAGTSQIQPWEKAWGWGVHHVNLQAHDVRETVGFYTEIAGLTEGRWRAPAARGDFSIATSELAVLPLGAFNRGLHIIRPDAGFAIRNHFAHNPSVGGHPAFHVKDVKAVKARLETAGIHVSDAGVYAMAGMHQIYAFDPTANMIEVNQFV